MARFEDVRTGATPWVLKIQHNNGEVSALRFSDFNTGNEFMKLVADYFEKDVRLSYMSEAQFIQQAEERGHDEWIDSIEDAQELDDSSDF